MDSRGSTQNHDSADIYLRYTCSTFFLCHPVNFVILAPVPIMSPFNQWPTQGGQSPAWSATAYRRPTSPHKLSLTAALVSFILISILISKAPFTRYNLLYRVYKHSTPFDNRFDNRLYRVYNRLSNRGCTTRFDNRLNAQHGCQTRRG